MKRRNAVIALVLATAAVLATAVLALAATKNGITPLSPKPGAAVPSGKSPTFRMRVRGRGQVWVHVCDSRKRNRKGVICDDSIGQAKRVRGRIYRYKPRFFDYPEFWLNQPGTYYWQAHRIDCGRNLDDCLKEGPVVRFRVR